MAKKKLEELGEIFICPDMENPVTKHNNEIHLHHKEFLPTHSVFKMVITEVKCTDTPEIIAARKKFINDLEVSSF